MNAPVLTDEQRRQGADTSLMTRQSRAHLKRFIAGKAEGSLQSADDLVRFEHALRHGSAQGMKVRVLLLALPGVGPARADGYLRAANIDPARTVRAIGENQREALLRAVAG